MHRDICSCSGGPPVVGIGRFFGFFLSLAPPVLSLPSPKLQFFVLMMTSYVLVLPIMYSTFFSFLNISNFFFSYVYLVEKKVIFLSWANTTYRPPSRPDTHTKCLTLFLSPSQATARATLFFAGGFFWFDLVCLFDKCRLWLIKLDFVKTHKRCVCMICDITQPAKYRFFLSSFLSFSVKPGCHPQKFLFLFFFPFLGFIQGCLLCVGT